MTTQFRPPQITGRTTAEQVEQLIRYLRQLAEKLQRFSREQRPLGEGAESRSFGYGTELSRGVSGVQTRRMLVLADRFQIRTAFSDWEGAPEDHQCFLVWGTVRAEPVLSVVTVCANGETSMVGEGIVELRTRETPGTVTLVLENPAQDYFVVQSVRSFRLQETEKEK